MLIAFPNARAATSPGSTKCRRARARLAVLAACAQAILLLCPAPAAVQKPRAPSPASKSSRAFMRAVLVGGNVPPESAAFEFESGGYAYRVAANGNGRGTKGRKVGRFNLRLDGGDYIDVIRFSEYEGDLLLACGVTDGAVGAGLVARLEQPSMRSLWKQRVPAANAGEPLREGRHLYVTGLGFVAMLDLETGAYAWQHAGLYGRGRADAFNSFAAPEIRGEEVLFKELPVYNGPALTVFVNRRTGKITRIE